MEYLRQMGAVIWKDLAVELRTRERVAAMGGFTILVGVLFNYSIDPTVVEPQAIASGLIWMTIVFGGMLWLGRTFHLEEEEGAFQGILLSPIPRDALFLGKVAANFLVLVVVTLLVCSFALHPRAGKAFVQFGSGVALVLAYYIVTVFLRKLGHRMVIPPALAAWTPNLIFLILGGQWFVRHTGVR